jgi:hypothetical protein
VKEVRNASQHPVPFIGAMSVVLSIIAIAVLLVIVVVNLRLRHGTRSAERHEADVRTRAGEAQHEASLHRRAEVRAAPAEQAETIASNTDE